MKLNIKKTFIDPLTEKKIKVPSVKNIMLLKGAGTYDKFNDIVNKQSKVTSKSLWKIGAPIAVGLLSVGTAACEYAAMRIRNEQCYDDAELLINEAAVYNEIEKESNN